MSEVSVNQGGGIGAVGILGIIFVVCKIFEIGPIAAWSWWFVLMPFYLGLAIILGVMLVGVIGVGLFAVVVAAIESYQDRQRSKKIAARLNKKG